LFFINKKIIIFLSHSCDVYHLLISHRLIANIKIMNPIVPIISIVNIFFASESSEKYEVIKSII